MVHIAQGALNFPKVVIADFFGVSRSAVTQSCRKRSNQDDLIVRVYNYLSRKISNPTASVHNIQQRSLDLLSDIRLIVQKRNVERVKVNGRPRVKFNFTEIKRLIRAIVAELNAHHSVVTAQTPVATTSTHSAPRVRRLRDSRFGMTAEEYEKFLDEYDSRAGKPIPYGFSRN